LVADKRDEEVKYDFKTTQSRPMLKPNLKILRHVAKVYTSRQHKVDRVSESDGTCSMAMTVAIKLLESVE
jgi:hypothetical protein